MVHIHEKIDYVGDVFIVNEDAVLLHMHEKYDMWVPPGGHVELNEDFVEAAIREAKEETGLDVALLVDFEVDTRGKDTGVQDIYGERELPLPQFINRHRVSSTHEHISFVYFATSTTRVTNPAEGEKREGFKWFTETQLHNASDVTDRVKKYALKALLVARKTSCKD